MRKAERVKTGRKLSDDICDLLDDSGMTVTEGLTVLNVLVTARMQEQGYSKKAALRIFEGIWDMSKKHA